MIFKRRGTAFVVLNLVGIGAICLTKFVTGSTVETEVSDTGTADPVAPLLGDKYDPSTTSPTKPMEWTILPELFGDSMDSLFDAWESHPTYLPGTLASATQTTTLSTVLPLKPRADRFSHLFDVSDLGTVLSDPALEHGSDYVVLKYVIRDGQEFNGQLPHKNIPLEHIGPLVNEKAFSVVINKMQDKWLPISKFARSLELETMCHSVSCNLYLTPPGGARGFESHLDWMDVIVVQVIGEKDWSVWTDPLVSTCVPDQKRRPTQQELGAKTPSTVRLVPGDALYIPRGFLHNATTPQQSGSVSLHLTFGIEHLCRTTMEALLHHALHLFVGAETTISKSIAVESPTICTAAQGFPAGDGISYETLLHLAISEVVRRTNCGGFGEQAEEKRGHDNSAICALRNSVPLHPQFQSRKGRTSTEVEEKYMAGLEAVSSYLSVVNAIRFLNKVMTKPDPLENPGEFCYPYANLEDFSYQCNPNAIPASIQEQFKEFTHQFVKFAKDKFIDARQGMIDLDAEHHVSRWEGVDWTAANKKEQLDRQ